MSLAAGHGPQGPHSTRSILPDNHYVYYASSLKFPFFIFCPKSRLPCRASREQAYAIATRLIDEYRALNVELCQDGIFVTYGRRTSVHRVRMAAGMPVFWINICDVKHLYRMRTSRTRQSLPPPHDSGSISDDTSETASDTRSDVESDVTDPIDYEWTGEHQLPEGLPVPPRIYFNGFGKIGSVAFGPIIHSDVPNPFGLERYRIPTSESLQRFAAGEFPEACFISFLLQYLVVELPRVSDREHVLRCSFLPRAIGLARIMITYANGPLVHKRQLYDPKAGERVRFEHTQDAKGKESIRDTTHSTSTGLRMDEEDYIEATNHFYPGSMMRSEEGVNFSASVPLVRGKEMGMPISLGCWQNRYNQGLHIAGNHTETFRIHHGNTLVCDKIERYNDSTVALAKIVKPALFKPKFFSVSIFAEIDPI